MIVVDSSALIEIVIGQPQADECMAVLASGDELVISAATLAETLIVARGRGKQSDVAELIERLQVRVVPVTAEVARAVDAAYGRWGRGFHPAALNFGDCFAYTLARELECPLLFVGNDFSRTDITSAL